MVSIVRSSVISFSILILVSAFGFFCWGERVCMCANECCLPTVDKNHKKRFLFAWKKAGWMPMSMAPAHSIDGIIHAKNKQNDSNIVGFVDTISYYSVLCFVLFNLARSTDRHANMTMASDVDACRVLRRQWATLDLDHYSLLPLGSICMKKMPKNVLNRNNFKLHDFTATRSAKSWGRFWILKRKPFISIEKIMASPEVIERMWPFMCVCVFILIRLNRFLQR